LKNNCFGSRKKLYIIEAICYKKNIGVYRSQLKPKISKNIYQTVSTITFNQSLEIVLFYFLEKDFETLFQ